MNPAFLFLPALLLFAPPSLGASWQTLKADAGMTLEAREPQAETAEAKAADQEKNKDRKLKIWSRNTHTQSQQAKPGDFYYTSSKTLWEVNCTARSVKPVEQVYYGDDGGESKHIRHTNGEKSRTTVPDTPEELLLDFACNFKQAKAAPPAAPRKPVEAEVKPSREAKPAAKVAPKKAAPKTAPKAAPKAAPSAKSPAAKPAPAASASKLAAPLKPTAK